MANVISCPRWKKKLAMPLVIIIQLNYCLNIMTNSYDIVSYMLPCLSAWMYYGCVNDITVHVTLLHEPFCLRDVMLLNIMTVSVLLDFKKEGSWNVKGFGTFSLVLQAIAASSQLKTGTALPEKLCDSLSGTCQNVIAFLLGILTCTYIKNRPARKAVLLSLDMQ